MFFEQIKTLDPQQRTAFPFTNFIRTLATIDLEAAKTFVGNTKPDKRTWAHHALIGGLSASGPTAGSSDQSLAHPGQQIGYAFGEIDPGSAFNWASSVTSNDEKRLYLLKRATDA